MRWRRLCLRYSQGKNCYKLNEVNYSAGVPGYVARANKLGYRAVAGPSGTTANILQYGLVRACSLSIAEVASDSDSQPPGTAARTPDAACTRVDPFIARLDAWLHRRRDGSDSAYDGGVDAVHQRPLALRNHARRCPVHAGVPFDALLFYHTFRSAHRCTHWRLLCKCRGMLTSGVGLGHRQTHKLYKIWTILGA